MSEEQNEETVEQAPEQQLQGDPFHFHLNGMLQCHEMFKKDFEQLAMLFSFSCEVVNCLSSKLIELDPSFSDKDALIQVISETSKATGADMDPAVVQQLLVECLNTKKEIDKLLSQYVEE